MEHKTVAIPQLRLGQLLVSWILPMLVATVLYSIVLPDNLFGDEFAEYRWAVLGENSFGMSLALNINTQCARLGHYLLGKPWAIRVHSMFFALGTIVLVAKLARRFLSPRGAILATWITALSPYLVEFGADARPHAIFIFAGILFLYALLIFMEYESWTNALFVIFAGCFGLLARPMFISILVFGFGYYIIKQKKVTVKLITIGLAMLPFIIRLYLRMMHYSNFAPKAPSSASLSISNLLCRLSMAFNFGYCTLRYPDREANWTISITDTISQNIFSISIVLIVFCGFLAGFLCYFRNNKEKACFLAGSVIIPISVLIIVQETGFSMLHVKHCAGVVGGYYILLAAIVTELFKYKWGKFVVLLYAYLIAISLFHFYFQPNIYSRRSNYHALNTTLEDNLKNEDYVIVYHRHEGDKPDYLTALQNTENTIDIYDDLPFDVNLDEYMRMINAECKGRILLIVSGTARMWVDPNDCVMSILQKERDYTLRKYGRSLSLYIFDKYVEVTK